MRTVLRVTLVAVLYISVFLFVIRDGTTNDVRGIISCFLACIATWEILVRALAWIEDGSVKVEDDRE